MDASNGVLHDTPTLFYFAAGVADAVRLDGLDKKWRVDAGALLFKLTGLTPGQTVALIDLAERYWASTPDCNVEGFVAPSHGDTLAALGLTVSESATMKESK